MLRFLLICIVAVIVVAWQRPLVRTRAPSRTMGQARPEGDGEGPPAADDVQAKLKDNGKLASIYHELRMIFGKGEEEYSEACERLGAPPTDFLVWDTQHNNRSDTVLQQTRSWVEQFIAGFGVCPFVQDADHAGLPDQLGKVSYLVSAAPTLMDAGRDFWRGVEAFRKNEGIAAMLVVFPQFSQDFVRFTLWNDDMNFWRRLASNVSLSVGAYHPLLLHEAERDGPRGMLHWLDTFTRRSPYPILCMQRMELLEYVKPPYYGSTMRMQRELTDMKLALVGKAKLQSMLDAKDWEDMRAMEEEFQGMCPYHAALRPEMWEKALRGKKAAEMKQK